MIENSELFVVVFLKKHENMQRFRLKFDDFEHDKVTITTSPSVSPVVRLPFCAYYGSRELAVPY